MRSRAGGEDSHNDRYSEDTYQGPTHRTHWRGNTPSRSLRSSSNPIDQNGSYSDQNSGQQIVQPDDIRIQICQHSHSANDGLPWNSQAQAEGHAEELRTLFPNLQNENEHGNRNDDQHEGQQTVAKFDEPVETHFWGGNERVFSAARPGGASQPGPGQPHGATCSNDQNLAHQRSPSRDADTAIDHTG